MEPSNRTSGEIRFELTCAEAKWLERQREFVSAALVEILSSARTNGKPRSVALGPGGSDRGAKRRGASGPGGDRLPKCFGSIFS